MNDNDVISAMDLEEQRHAETANQLDTLLERALEEVRGIQGRSLLDADTEFEAASKLLVRLVRGALLGQEDPKDVVWLAAEHRKRKAKSNVIPFEKALEERCWIGKLPDRPSEMTYWLKIAERWDSLERQLRYAKYPGDDWTAEEWEGMSEENREAILASRRASVDAALERLVSFSKRLSKAGKRLRTIAEDSEREWLLDCRNDIETWLRDQNGRPWVVPEAEDLEQMETDARAHVRAKQGNAGLKNIAAHMVHQMFPSHGYDEIRKL